MHKLKPSKKTLRTFAGALPFMMGVSLLVAVPAAADGEASSAEVATQDEATSTLGPPSSFMGMDFANDRSADRAKALFGFFGLLACGGLAVGVAGVASAFDQKRRIKQVEGELTRLKLEADADGTQYA